MKKLLKVVGLGSVLFFAIVLGLSINLESKDSTSSISFRNAEALADQVPSANCSNSCGTSQYMICVKCNGGQCSFVEGYNTGSAGETCST